MIPGVPSLTVSVVYFIILGLEFTKDLEGLLYGVVVVRKQLPKVNLTVIYGLVVQLTYAEVPSLPVDGLEVEVRFLLEYGYRYLPVYPVLLAVALDRVYVVVDRLLSHVGVESSHRNAHHVLVSMGNCCKKCQG